MIRLPFRGELEGLELNLRDAEGAAQIQNTAGSFASPVECCMPGKCHGF